ncbi:hypothetical protein P280DRAFT_469363 [Massarina eburnea CBS 473.64]|uniref:Uncharacterized protein n=1 Tax=Massarina eburnea CBS 473.64 TaxID=1395130 RepID=A0A6A6S2M4_9PLEO|nr:hypothetical protein P280DRAFT_469363 [Massarina eburnea CBS 473.64]
MPLQRANREGRIPSLTLQPTPQVYHHYPASPCLPTFSPLVQRASFESSSSRASPSSSRTTFATLIDSRLGSGSALAATSSSKPRWILPDGWWQRLGKMVTLDFIRKPSSKSQKKFSGSKRKRSKIQKKNPSQKLHQRSMSLDSDPERNPLTVTHPSISELLEKERAKTAASRKKIGQPKDVRVGSPLRGGAASIQDYRRLSMPLHHTLDIENTYRPEEGMSTIDSHKALTEQMRPITQPIMSMEAAFQNAGTKRQCLRSHPPNCEAPTPEKPSLRRPSTEHEKQLHTSLQITNPQAGQDAKRNDEPLAEHHLLVGKQVRRSSNVESRPSSVPDIPELEATTSFTTATTSSPAIDESIRKAATPVAYELDAVSTNVPYVSVLDPHAMELYRRYDETGEIECCISEFCTSSGGKNCSWQVCWSLINAYIHGTNMRDIAFSDRCMDILSRSIASGVPADIETIKHVFTAEGIPGKLKQFVIDRCVGAGKKVMEKEGLDLRSLPQEFIYGMLETTFQLLGESEKLEGREDGCRYHLHLRPERCYRLKGEQAKERATRMCEEAQRHSMETLREGEVATATPSDSSSPNTSVELDASTSATALTIMTAFDDGTEPTSNTDTATTDVSVTVRIAQPVMKQRAKLVDSPRRRVDPALSRMGSRAGTRAGFTRLGAESKRPHTVSNAERIIGFNAAGDNKEDRHEVASKSNGDLTAAAQAVKPAAIERRNTSAPSVITESPVSTPDTALFNPIQDVDSGPAYDLPSYEAAGRGYRVNRTQSVQASTSNSTLSLSSNSSRCGSRNTSRSRVGSRVQSVISMLDLYSSGVPGAYPQSQSQAGN